MDPQNEQQPQTAQRASIEGLRGQRTHEANLPMITPGFGSLQGYELMVRQAKALSSSTLVPPQYRQVIVKLNRNGTIKSTEDNANAIPNCMIALNMATRMNADPLMVMQNLVVVEGRPSWSSQWVIAQINNCGRFEPLRFDIIEKGKTNAPYEFTEWTDGPGNQRIPERKTRTVEIDDVECTAWTVPKGVKIPHGVQTIDDAKKAGLPVLKGPKVSIKMAVAEGWYTKTGSKWQTMPELMLHYRSGSFFGRLYAPELLMGIPSEDEVIDMGTLVAAADGTFAPAEAGAPDPMAPSIDALRRTAQAGHSADAEDVQPREHSAQQASDTPAAGSQQKEGASDAPAKATTATTQPQGNRPSEDGSLFGHVE